MKLKIKNFNWLAGKPVVILNDSTAKEMNVFVDDRVILSNGHSIHALVDISPRLVKKGEVGLSREASSLLKLQSGFRVEINNARISEASNIIREKMEKKELSAKELIRLIDAIVNNKITDSEIAYFIAAEKLAGMSMKETIALTKAMIKTGASLKFKGKYVADKHCIGGIAGNRTTPIVVSICAAAGLTIPKTSSRAITSASGTADVVETVSNVNIPLNRLKKIIERVGASLAWGGSLGLAPSDDKIIHIERLLNLDVEPQLLASIMSKKISAGSKYLLIDIPYGRGSKVGSLKEAKKLGKKFEIMARHFRIKLKAVYTSGIQPIGNGFGPVLEMMDVLKVFQNDKDAPKDLKQKSLYLSSELMKLCKIKRPKKKAKEILESGKALEKFREIINAQNGKKDFDQRIKKLKPAKFKKTIISKKSGKISHINNKKMNSLCRILGTPETKGAGIFLYRHLGRIKKGDKIITLYAESETKMKDALRFYKKKSPIEIK